MWDGPLSEWGDREPGDAVWGGPLSEWGDREPGGAVWGGPLSEWGDRDPGGAVWGGFITHTFLEVYVRSECVLYRRPGMEWY